MRGHPRWGGRAKIENSSRCHPRKFGQKRFLAVRKVLVGKWGSLFLGYLLGKNIGGVVVLISFRLTWDGCSSLPLRRTPSMWERNSWGQGKCVTSNRSLFSDVWPSRSIFPPGREPAPSWWRARAGAMVVSHYFIARRSLFSDVLGVSLARG